MALSSRSTTLIWTNGAWTEDNGSSYYKIIYAQDINNLTADVSPTIGPIITTVNSKGMIEAGWSAIVKIETVGAGGIKFWTNDRNLADTLYIAGPNETPVTILINGY